MQVDLSLSAASALFRELIERTELPIELVEVRETLRPLCQLDLTWRALTQDGLPCIHGLGWAVVFKERPNSTDSPETYLRDHDAGRCYVLPGDHRADFEKVAESGLPALLRVYAELDGDSGRGYWFPSTAEL